MVKRLTTEEFINKARNIHKQKYSYKKTNYTKAKEPVVITCSKHGDFKQTPDKHLSGCGCPICGGNQKSNTNTFIEKAKRVHRNKYDYSKVEYKKAIEKVCIICPEHGEFWQTPNKHLSGQGCPKCAGNISYDKNEFIRRAQKIHGDKYDYSSVDFVGTHKPVNVICKEHGIFTVLPYNHIGNKSGCPVCAGNKLKTTQEFIKEALEIWGDTYNYSKTKYDGAFNKIIVGCKEHGDFTIIAKKHLEGGGCQKCHSSKLEQEIRLFLQKHYKGLVVEQYSPSWLNQQSLDFYLPSLNIGIECQGIQHFKPREHFGGEQAFIKTVELDKNKLRLCNENGTRLLYYSNLKIKYPYQVYEDKNKLLQEIMTYG